MCTELGEPRTSTAAVHNTTSIAALLLQQHHVPPLQQRYDNSTSVKTACQWIRKLVFLLSLQEWAPPSLLGQHQIIHCCLLYIIYEVYKTLRRTRHDRPSLPAAQQNYSNAAAIKQTARAPNTILPAPTCTEEEKDTYRSSMRFLSSVKLFQRRRQTWKKCPKRCNAPEIYSLYWRAFQRLLSPAHCNVSHDMKQHTAAVVVVCCVRITTHGQ